MRVPTRGAKMGKNKWIDDQVRRSRHQQEEVVYSPYEEQEEDGIENRILLVVIAILLLGLICLFAYGGDAAPTGMVYEMFLWW